MKKYTLPVIALLSLSLAVGCHSHDDGHDHGHDHDAAEAAEVHNHEHHEGHEHKHGPHEHDEEESADEIRLAPAMAARFGVECDTVRRAGFAEAVHTTGRVLATGSEMAAVATPTSGILSFSSAAVPGKEVGRGARIATVRTGATTGGDANRAAKAALDAASRELERIKPLYAERLVTGAEYNAALAAYESAKAEFSASGASGAVTSPIAGVIISLDAVEGQFVEVGTPIATVASDRNLTLRIDLPRSKASRIASFTDARIALGDGSVVRVSELGGRRSGAAVSAGNAASAYVPVFFTVPNRGGMFLAGSGFEAWLTGAENKEVVSVPLSALSEQMGNYFVYERLDDECYRKLPVTTGASDGERVEILGGLAPGTVIATKGVTTLRLSENAKAIPEGHSHNH